MTRHNACGWVIMLLVIGMSVTCFAATSNRIERLLPTVVMVGSKDGVGSGIIVDQDTVATACHVVDDDVVWKAISVYKPQVTGELGKEYPAVTLFRDIRRDVCLLFAPGLSDDVDLRQARRQMTNLKTEQGDAVSALGVKDYQVRFTVGEVVWLNEISSGNCTLETIQERRPQGRGGICLRIEPRDPILPGWSGGPIYDGAGLLIGMLVASNAEGDHAAAAPVEWINEAWEAATLRREIISGWRKCIDDFRCASNVISRALRKLPERSRNRRDALVSWIDELARRGNFREALTLADDLHSGHRIAALTNIAVAYAESDNRSASKTVFDEAKALALTKRGRQYVRVRNLLTIGEAQARAGFVGEARHTFESAFKTVDETSLVISQVEDILWIGVTASGVGLFDLADMAYERALVLASDIKRENTRSGMARDIEHEMVLSRMARGNSPEDMAARLHIERQLAELNRHVQDRHYLSLSFIERNAKLAGQVFRSGEEALARHLFTELITWAEQSFQERQARALSVIGSELVELDMALARNLYLRALGGLESVKKFWEDLEDKRTREGKAQSERRTSGPLDEARLMVVEGLARTGRFTAANKLAAEIDEKRMREKAYRTLAMILLSSGEREKGYRTATNISDGALFTSVFIAGTRLIYDE